MNVLTQTDPMDYIEDNSDWEIIEMKHGMELHVSPINDWALHTMNSLRCDCKPIITYEEQGTNVITHNAYDSRDLYKGFH